MDWKRQEFESKKIKAYFRQKQPPEALYKKSCS